MSNAEMEDDAAVRALVKTFEGMVDRLTEQLATVKAEASKAYSKGYNAGRLRKSKDDTARDDAYLELLGERRSLRQLLLDADAVARARGDDYGLCDCVDNVGNPYPSQFGADLLDRARKDGFSADYSVEEYRQRLAKKVA